MIHIEAQNAIPEIAGYLAKGVQRDAVLTEMADYLVRRGAVKESYGSAVIQRENTFPTGIPVEPIAVAIPHSDRDLVVNTTILVAKLEQTVPFHRIDDVELEVDVKVVFMLAVRRPDPADRQCRYSRGNPGTGLLRLCSRQRRCPLDPRIANQVEILIE